MACRGSDIDSYGRLIALCFHGGRDLSQWMVEQGWAAAYRRYSEDYVSSEEAAKRSAQGIWVGPFVMHWDWRRGERVGDRREAKPRADGCAIEGYINSEGIKIYHVPGGSKICLLPTLVTLQPERVCPIAAKPRS